MVRKNRLSVHILAVLVWLSSAVNIQSALLPRLREAQLREYLPLEAIHGGRLLAVVAGFLLMFLGHGIWRHKRRAWQASVAVIGLSILLHLVKGWDWEQATGSLLLLAALIALRNRFRAASDPPSLRRGLSVLASSLAFTCVYGTVGFYFLDREFHARFGLAASLRETLRLFFTFNDPLIPFTAHGEWFIFSLSVVGSFSICYGAWSALRPAVYRSTAWPVEQQHAAEIALHHGRSSLARLTLLPDKTFFFPAAGEAYLAFRLAGNVAVVLGDPICETQQMAEVISSFGDYCAEMDWTPCFYQVLPDYLPAYQQAGFSFLKIGEEGIIDLPSFTLEGGERKDLRHGINRLLREGNEAHFLLPPIEEAMLDELEEVSREWLHTMHGGEKRFSLGWFDRDYLRSCEIETVTSSHGRVEAFANLYSEYQLPIITPDLMRRRATAPDGVMDFLFVQAIFHYRARGYEGLNLGLAPLSGVGEGEQTTGAERVVKLMYEHLNRFYSFKGLRAFKEKFHPRWEPRYLIYPAPASLPKAALAVLRANNPKLFWKR